MLPEELWDCLEALFLGCSLQGVLGEDERTELAMESELKHEKMLLQRRLLGTAEDAEAIERLCSWVRTADSALASMGGYPGTLLSPLLAVEHEETRLLLQVRRICDVRLEAAAKDVDPGLASVGKDIGIPLLVVLVEYSLPMCAYGEDSWIIRVLLFSRRNTLCSGLTEGGLAGGIMF